MKKLVLMTGCLLALGSAPAVAQQQADVVTVRVEEQGYTLYVFTARNGSDIVEPELLRTAKREQPSSLVARTYQRIMATYLAQGYVLQSDLAGRTDVGHHPVSTFIFVKAPKP